VSPAKTAEPIEIPFGLWTWVSLRNHVRLGCRSPTGVGNFEEGKAAFFTSNVKKLSKNQKILRQGVATSYTEFCSIIMLNIPDLANVLFSFRSVMKIATAGLVCKNRKQLACLVCVIHCNVS